MIKLFKRKRKVPWPITLKDAIGLIFSRNSIVNLWIYGKDNNEKIKISHSMAWEIPRKYLNYEIHKVMGIVPEKIMEGDSINLLIAPPDINGGDIE